jgi:hypothetical protein
MLNVAAR